MARDLKLVKYVINTGAGIIILDCDLVQLFIVNAHSKRTICLLSNNTGAPHVEILGMINPLSRRSLK